MPARPWYPKYPADYAIDTQRLTYEQHGLYNLILYQLWIRGPLPDDPVEISEILGKDPRSTARIYNSIRPFFHLNNGRIMSRKLEKLRAEADRVGKMRADAAIKRWGKTAPGLE
jgi:uncharacterized protein YdaU (DUF1376 family)